MKEGTEVKIFTFSHCLIDFFPLYKYRSSAHVYNCNYCFLAGDKSPDICKKPSGLNLFKTWIIHYLFQAWPPLWICVMLAMSVWAVPTRPGQQTEWPDTNVQPATIAPRALIKEPSVQRAPSATVWAWRISRSVNSAPQEHIVMWMVRNLQQDVAIQIVSLHYKQTIIVFHLHFGSGGCGGG